MFVSLGFFCVHRTLYLISKAQHLQIIAMTHLRPSPFGERITEKKILVHLGTSFSSHWVCQLLHWWFSFLFSNFSKAFKVFHFKSDDVHDASCINSPWIFLGFCSFVGFGGGSSYLLPHPPSHLMYLFTRGRNSTWEFLTFLLVYMQYV